MDRFFSITLTQVVSNFGDIMQMVENSSTVHMFNLCSVGHILVKKIRHSVTGGQVNAIQNEASG